MALAKRKSNSSRIVVIGLVVVIVAGLGYVLFQQFFINGGAGTGITTPTGSRTVITNFGEQILNDPRFTTLKSYDVTINANAETDGGQPNPFQ